MVHKTVEQCVVYQCIQTRPLSMSLIWSCLLCLVPVVSCVKYCIGLLFNYYHMISTKKTTTPNEDIFSPGYAAIISELGYHKNEHVIIVQLLSYNIFVTHSDKRSLKLLGLVRGTAKEVRDSHCGPEACRNQIMFDGKFTANGKCFTWLVLQLTRIYGCFNYELDSNIKLSCTVLYFLTVPISLKG